MRFFWSFFWIFILMHMVNYVVSSMNGVGYDFVSASIFGVVTTILIYAISVIIPNEPNREGEAH